MTAILIVLACGLGWAQTPASTNVMNAPYPQVHPDLRATFRLNAPEARSVSVSIAHGKYEMTRAADGHG